MRTLWMVVVAVLLGAAPGAYSFTQVVSDQEEAAPESGAPAPAAPGAVTFNVTGMAGVNGAIDPHVTTAVPQGGSLVFTFTPDAGYAVSSISVDNVVTPYTQGTYTFSNVQSDHMLVVYFSAIPPPPPHHGGGGGGGGGGCSLAGPAGAAGAAGWALPYLALLAGWARGRRRARK